ncbi:MAG: MoxR family ATPase [Candidatus Eisenbacteria bacterium]|uniref:MoxR family ATPase n=1 Tax=Eiseniibacteriota bacterium TaxID=2212470 RepID=A0A948RVP3_UNCEI|nr:MoxR family ATPase [Candidatus Eisenbacteria bacterium]MBU1951086.1 MoxR family ATPase [Candidatus Eisenbacteria bacterium]MBU2690554.1 MoxR family ATPase [Candidatus Eisenbacteria bacterium]
MDLQAIKAQLEELTPAINATEEQIARVIVGQKDMVRKLLVGLLADGHVLLEGVPGLAKTLAVRALSGAIQARFSRIQFTPDLLPSDLTGTMVYNPRSGEFTVHKGPVFTNIVLADEINRAPAKVQSALLEAMQERQVTLGETTYPLEEPFLVLATQNPIEQEGTYPLPEAQVDRFMLKLRVGYPSPEEEKEILGRMTGSHVPEVRQVITPKNILDSRAVVRQIYMDEKITDYIVQIIFASREPERVGLHIGGLIAYGASPRGTINLALAAKAHAFISGRPYVVPEDVKAIAPDVLRHRILTTYEAEAEEVSSDDLVQKILDHVEVP